MSSEESLRSGLPNNYAQQFDFGIFKQAATNVLRQLKISIRKTLPENMFSTDLISINCSTTLGGAIIQSHVKIGYFTIGFTMILLDIDVPNSDLETIGTGGFSKIMAFLNPNQNDNYVAKRIFIKQSSQNCYRTQLKQHLKLKQVIMEFAIYKIADLFDIGPKVVNFGFDIVCFKNAAQFYLERCAEAECIESYRLKYCVRVLHSISFAHRDIKPHNLLYSQSKGKLVLSDYGLTKAVKQKIFQKTKTSYCGTQLFTGKQMKNIKGKGTGLVNLFLNDLQSTDITLKSQTNSNQNSGMSIISAFSDFDYQKDQQVSTADTHTSKSPIQYCILYQIYDFYIKNKSFDFQQYSWKKWILNQQQQKQQLILKMFPETQLRKVKNLIYCYGFNSKLLNKLYHVSKDYYSVIKDYFLTSEAKKYLKQDFHYRFEQLFQKTEQVLFLIKKSASLQEAQLKQKQFEHLYAELQFIVLNQFKTITSVDEEQTNKLFQKMKKIDLIDLVDPIWDLAIIFVQCCMGKNKFSTRDKIVKDVLISLKSIIGHQPKKLFQYLSDMIVFSNCSNQNIQKAYVYKQIIQVQNHLSNIKRLLNKCYLMKYSRNSNSQQYLKIKLQIQLQLKIVLLQECQQQDKFMLIQIQALLCYQNEQFSESLKLFLDLKNNLIHEYGMNKQICSTLYSIAYCYYKLNMYKQVTNTFRDIRTITEQISSYDYQIIAHSFYMLGNYKRAKKYYILSYDSTPISNGKLQYYIGCCWMEMMQWQNAIQFFQKSIAQKDKLSMKDIQYMQTKMKKIDCELYRFQNKSFQYYEYKYQQLVSNLSNYEFKQDQKSELFFRLYLRLEIFYSKFQQISKRSLVLLIIKGFCFNHKLDNLYERAGIYYSLKMYEQAYIYSYASCLRLKHKVPVPQYLKNLIIDRKQKISKSLSKSHIQFKQLFYSIRSGKQFVPPSETNRIIKYISQNNKIKSLCKVLQPFYYKQKFEQIVNSINSIGKTLKDKLISQGNE